MLEKVIRSAMANAEDQRSSNVQSLVVTEVRVELSANPGQPRESEGQGRQVSPDHRGQSEGERVEPVVGEQRIEQVLPAGGCTQRE